MSEYSHIAERFRQNVHLSNEKRIEFINSPRWVGYKKANDVIKILQKVMTQPKHHRMQNLLLIGNSNNGKTTIINEFYELYGQPEVNEAGELHLPICMIESPPSANEKDLLVSIVNALQLPYRRSDTSGVLRIQVTNALRETHTKMLIIDEVHSMLTGTARQQRTIMNVLKFLCNSLQMPIVLCGTNEAVRILHTDPQHQSRFDVAELPLWQENSAFQYLVGSFERILPLKEPSNLAKSIEKLHLIHSISGGNLGNLKRLLNNCAIQAIEEGEEKITLDIIKNNMNLKPKKGLRQILS